MPHRTIFLSALSGLLIILPLMFIVWVRSEFVKTGYRMWKVLEEREYIIEENQRLKKKLNQLTSLLTLRKIAEEKRMVEKDLLIIELEEEEK